MERLPLYERAGFSPPFAYLISKVEIRSHPNHAGLAVFVTEPIATGELVAAWGGIVYTGAQLKSLDPYMRSHTIQIEEDLFLTSLHPEEPADFINHSCDPNLGLSGQITLVAMRDIEVGEELCFDYAMSDGTPYDEFECDCGSPYCRGHVTGEDWRNPELWERYAGYFSPYLQRRIDNLQAEKLLRPSKVVEAPVQDDRKSL